MRLAALLLIFAPATVLSALGRYCVCGPNQVPCPCPNINTAPIQDGYHQKWNDIRQRMYKAFAVPSHPSSIPNPAFFFYAKNPPGQTRGFDEPIGYVLTSSPVEAFYLDAVTGKLVPTTLPRATKAARESPPSPFLSTASRRTVLSNGGIRQLELQPFQSAVRLIRKPQIVQPTQPLSPPPAGIPLPVSAPVVAPVSPFLPAQPTTPATIRSPVVQINQSNQTPFPRPSILNPSPGTFPQPASVQSSVPNLNFPQPTNLQQSQPQNAQLQHGFGSTGQVNQDQTSARPKIPVPNQFPPSPMVPPIPHPSPPTTILSQEVAQPRFQPHPTLTATTARPITVQPVSVQTLTTPRPTPVQPSIDPSPVVFEKQYVPQSLGGLINTRMVQPAFEPQLQLQPQSPFAQVTMAPNPVRANEHPQPNRIFAVSGDSEPSFVRVSRIVKTKRRRSNSISKYVLEKPRPDDVEDLSFVDAGDDNIDRITASLQKKKYSASFSSSPFLGEPAEIIRTKPRSFLETLPPGLVAKVAKKIASKLPPPKFSFSIKPSKPLPSHRIV